MSLATKLRPSRFEDVIGHQSVIKTLRTQIDGGRVSPAYLFGGPTGVGKTTLALILSRYVQGPTFSGDLSMDVHELNAADSNGVKDARQIAEDVKLRPWEATYRVVILNEAHKLTEEAQNALLHPFENSGSTVFIITTTEPDKILPALRGRCQCFYLKPLSDDNIRELVKRAEPYSTLSTEDAAERFIGENIRAGRDILNILSKEGMTLDDAIESPEANPVFIEIARAMVSNNWTQASKNLKGVRAADGKPLRAVLASYLKKIVLEGGQKADIASEALRGLFLYQSFEDGTALSGTIAWIYQVCKKFK